jgi:rubrerythrin
MATKQRDGVAEVDVEISPAEMLATLARLDLEAALAYEVAARVVKDRELAGPLASFARDHRRHVEAIDRVLRGLGAPTVGEALEGPPFLAGLMQIAGPLGPDVIVVALLGNEQLTNLGCDAALAYEWDGALEAMLRRFQADEERHLGWLAERHDAMGLHAEGGRSPLLE